ncbi:MAG: ABC transporter ATP-binding protein [Dehalococcoidia bacterium]
MAAVAVNVSGVRKSYGALEALKGVDLEVRKGEVFSLLGPNGAGKTTLVEILEGYRSRSGGEASVLGVDPGKGGAAWKARIGIVLQSTAVFDALTVEELVRHFADFYPAPLEPARVIDLVGLSEKRQVRCAKLSGGQKRRVDLALGIIGDPELIFLDEPTTGLDPEGRRQLWEVVRNFTALGKTVMLTTHYLDEAEALSDRVGVIIGGELVETGKPDEIGGRNRAMATVRFETPPGVRERPLPPLAGVVTQADGHVSVQTEAPTAVVSALAGWAAAAGMAELPGLTVTRPTLEETYLRMVDARRTNQERRN